MSPTRGMGMKWVAAALLLAASPVALGRVVYVDAAAAGADNGKSWADAYRSLQHGLLEAYFADDAVEVRIARGTYRPDQACWIVPGDRGWGFPLQGGVAIKGGYVGIQGADPNVRDSQAFRTVLSGDLAQDDVGGLDPCSLLTAACRRDNSYHVVKALGVGPSAVLDGVVITGGTANGTANERLGGGIVIADGSPRLAHCTFESNAALRGGSAYVQGGSPTLEDCTFSGSYASSRGGGLSCSGSAVINVADCRFVGNDANEAGGAVYFEDCSGSASGCTLARNTAAFGGAVLGYDADVRFVKCRFETDSALVKGGAAYCIAEAGGVPTWSQCRFERCHALQGGAIYAAQIDMSLAFCTFKGNHSDEGGGAIYNDHSRPQIANCLFLGNTAGGYAGQTVFHNQAPLKPELDPPMMYVLRGFGPDGGALYNYECGPTLVNCTFALNRAQNLGGAICTVPPQYKMPGSSVATMGTVRFRLSDCTLYQNRAAWGPDLYNHAGDVKPDLTNCVLWSNLQFRSRRTPRPALRGVTASHSDIETGWPGTGNIDIFPGISLEGYLLAGSPCVDAGDPNFVLDPNNPLDVHGSPRIAGARVDIGSDEFTDTDADGLPDGWEKEHFGSVQAGDPLADDDGDGLSNLEECGFYTGNPVRPPLCVDAAKAGDLQADGTQDHPFGTIQQALDAALYGDTVLVGPGVYAGKGNADLDYGHKWLALRSTQGPDQTVIDCNGLGRAIRYETTVGVNALLDGFTIRGGGADPGQALRMESCRFVITDSILTGHGRDPAGCISCAFSELAIGDLSIHGSSTHPGEPNLGKISFSNVAIGHVLDLQGGTLGIVSSSFEGPGRVTLASDASLVASTYPGAAATTVHCDVLGPGNIVIEPGQQLIVEANAVVRLADASSGQRGRITVEGSLVVRGNATLQDSDVFVKLMRLEDANAIQYNDIRLLEASTGFGGEFFVAGRAKVRDNTILSEGDRYLDLDPDPDDPNHPSLSGNRITVVVKEAPWGVRGPSLSCEPGTMIPEGSTIPRVSRALSRCLRPVRGSRRTRPPTGSWRH